ncbi:hypothetical protein N9M16_00075 [Candidatus Dependentiae bacterium]|jgi:hypothetical protein|nr:hypothetical protein [Candidatus Dependentiae bacterium]|tara:strand:- start:96 stop:248 length:153 start_codon:yes stop_codon:yes gene_type:complete
MPTKSAVEAAIGADDELGEELLESLRDTVSAPLFRAGPNNNSSTHPSRDR